MRVHQSQSTTFLGVCIAFFALAAGLIFMLTHSQVQAASDQSGRLMTIHDRGQEKVILTEAATVAEALTQAGITLDERDAVEPALTEKLVATEYQVNIYRARPVTVIDGPIKQQVVTPYQTANQIAKDAGITLFAEDATKIIRSDDIVGDGPGLQLLIDRATLFSLNLYGKVAEVRTQGATVGEMLREKGITLTENDRVVPVASTPLTPGLAVKVWREGKQTVTIEEAVAFDVEQIKDADRNAGYKDVQVAGQNGTRNVTYEIEIQNGKEVARHEIASLVITQPIKQVEVIGVKVALMAGYSAERVAIMTAAGVAPSDQGYAAYIIDHENASWCPTRWQGQNGCPVEYVALYPEGYNLGYGLCQATPGNKMATAGADWRTNVVTQMKWCAAYAIGRYGSWQAAYEFKVTRGWW